MWICGVGSLESVAHRWFRVEIHRLARIRLKFASNMGHVDSQIIGLGLVLRPPDRFQEGLRRHELTLMAHENFHDAPFDTRQPDLDPVLPDLLGKEIENERTAVHNGGGTVVMR